jgi:hypothetical protein
MSRTTFVEAHKAGLSELGMSDHVPLPDSWYGRHPHAAQRTRRPIAGDRESIVAVLQGPERNGMRGRPTVLRVLSGGAPLEAFPTIISSVRFIGTNAVGNGPTR